MTDEEIKRAYDVSLRTIERTCQRFVEDSYELALHGQPRPVNREKLLDGRLESHLIALQYSKVPGGHNKWSLHLLAEKLVELEYVESISRQSVHYWL